MTKQSKSRKPRRSSFKAGKAGSLKAQLSGKGVFGPTRGGGRA